MLGVDLANSMNMVLMDPVEAVTWYRPQYG